MRKRVFLILSAVASLLILFAYIRQKHYNASTIENEQKHYDINTMENEREYTVFTHIHKNLKNGSEQDVVRANHELIQSLPETVKAIIARYSTFIPDYMLSDDEQSKLAKSLGDFSSLEEAQSSLLKIWGVDFSLSKKMMHLTVKETEQLIAFYHSFVFGGGYDKDEFTIDACGNISHIKSYTLKENYFNEWSFREH